MVIHGRMKLRRKRLEQDVRQTYKSNDTEEWLDRVFTRPIGYLWARFFQSLGVHPNVVTVLSISIGVSSACFFVHDSWRTEGTYGIWMNIIGIALMMLANFYDSADGQLARMTGKNTELGRILDGSATIIIFVPVYCVMVWRCYLHHGMEFQWMGIADTERNALVYGLLLFGISLFSGFVCLIDLPWLYFVFEIVVMSALCEYMRRRHERMCASIHF